MEDDIPDLVPLQEVVSDAVDDKQSVTVSVATTTDREVKADAAVPLCILTGWLGAGKTTLLTYLLDTLGKQGKQIAIVQNEGTAMGVEDALRSSCTTPCSPSSEKICLLFFQQ